MSKPKRIVNERRIFTLQEFALDWNTMSIPDLKTKYRASQNSLYKLATFHKLPPKVRSRIGIDVFATPRVQAHSYADQMYHAQGDYPSYASTVQNALGKSSSSSSSSESTDSEQEDEHTETKLVYLDGPSCSPRTKRCGMVCVDKKKKCRTDEQRQDRRKKEAAKYDDVHD